jgi:leucyl-tRNA synthetase
MVAMLAPLVPHIAEELWSKLGHGSGSGSDDGGTITYVDFPVADPSLLVDDTVELPIQINGKVRSRVSVATDANKATIEAAALADPKVIEALAGGEPKKLIVVPGRMINIVV